MAEQPDIAHHLAHSRAPRYTSYPTAPHFGPLEAGTHLSWLGDVGREPDLSLYVHIPFCREMCWFCGCHMAVANRYGRVARFLDALAAEITMVADALEIRRRVRHLHFGGGSPTILTAEDFTRLMDLIHERFEILPRTEVAIEIDPRTLTEEKVKSYARSGINRASLGVQDFKPEVQAAIHRVQPLGVVENAIRWCREAGIGAINMDLIYGLPHQTLKSVRETVELAITFKPARVALFAYAHVPWLKKHQRMIDEAALPRPEDRIAMHIEMARAFEAAGYTAIGMDHFARADDTLTTALQAGKLQRNFQGYTADGADVLIGFGPSAIGRLPGGYVQNTPNLPDYEEDVSSQRPAVVRGHAFRPDDALYKDVIDTLMCTFKADLAVIADRHGADVEKFKPELKALKPLEEAGLAKLEGWKVTLATDYRMAIRSVAACFDQYIGEGGAKYSRVA